MSRAPLAAALAVAALFPATASAVTTPTGVQLPGDGLSASVAIDGTTAIQGGGVDSTGLDVASAQVFSEGSSGWTQSADLLSLTAAFPTTREYGRAVAISGNWAAVADQGAVYMYVNNNGTWSLSQQITPPADLIGSSSDFGIPNSGQFDYGPTLALSGSTMVIGDANDNNFDGAAWVYTLTPGAGWTEQQKLTGGPGSGFGTSVAVNGNEILVGAPGDNGGEGAAYAYTNSGGSWSADGTLTIPNTNGTPLPSQTGFGDSVGIDGSTAVVGQNQGGTFCAFSCPPSGSGEAWAFQNVSGSTWAPVQQLNSAGFPDPGIEFGRAVAISGSPADHIVVGSGFDGHGYVFTSAGASWAPAEELSASSSCYADGFCGGGGSNSFGDSVGVSGSTAIVNAGNENAYVFP